MEQRRPHRELQLLPSSGCQISSWPSDYKPRLSLDPPASLDLQLSISLRGPTASAKGKFKIADGRGGGKGAAEQIRLAATEKAYAERVRELARKEMELAQNELARASHVWEEVGWAERLKERATYSVAAEGITCHCCRQRFLRPSE